MGTRTHVYFGVFDFGGDPGKVSTLMDMEPTVAWVKGEHHIPAFPNARRTHSRWALSSGVDEKEPVEAHLAALLERLQTRRAQITEVARLFPTQIVVAQYFYEVNPQFCMGADLLQRFADLGLPIYFDQYCLGQEEESPSAV